MPLMNHPVAFARPACSASSLQRYAADSTTAAAAHPKTKPLIHSVSRRFSRLLFACAPLLLGAAALVPATPAQAQVVDICDRTAQVETAILAKLSHSDCSAVTSAELAGIGGTLALNSKGITSLQAGDFSGLSSVTSLNLASNSLTSLPDGVFGELIYLTSLDLGSNQLASLPDEIFNSPAKLTDLDLSGNSGAPFTVTLSLIAGDFNTVRVQMTSSAWATFGVPLVAGNGTLSMSSVTIPKGATLSNAVAFTPDSDSNTVSTVSIDTLPTLPTNFAGLTLAKGSSLTMIQGGICTRSPKVRAYILNALSGVSDCGEVTATHLASLTGTMTLSAQGATTLQAGDFAGLSGLTGLDLANRNIASLPQGVFGDLAKLTTLNLSGNSLTELPAGVFAGLSSLSSVDLSGNTGAPFTLPLVLREDGNGGVHVYLEHGAPRALSIPLQVAGGSLSASSVTIAAGATISQTVTYTADGSGDAMSVSFGVTLPSAGTGVQLGAGASLTFADDGICGRTWQVQTAILAWLEQNDCGAVTRDDLAGIGGTLDLSGFGIASLRYGDFSGLSSLTGLGLSDNELTSLPEGVFSGLSSLESLILQNNALTSLPSGVFSGLSSLEYLELNHIALTSLPEGVFSGLSSLEILYLQNNALTSLPSGVFSGLSSLEYLNLNGNALTSLLSGVFSGLSSLEYLNLNGNALTSLPEGEFSGLSSLETLYLGGALTSLPEGVFSGLSSLDDLSLGGALTSLPEGVFSGLSSLTSLTVRGDALTSLPEGVFSGLSSLTSLTVRGDALTSLPEGVFSGLRSLTDLRLTGTALTSLPEGVFSGLSSLIRLWLQGNALTSLPVGMFSGLSSLTFLRLSDNPGTPFQVELSLESDSATSTVRILAPLGAPEDLAIPLSISGGTVAGSTNATVTIPAGATTSPPVTVDVTAADGVVTVSFDTLPALTPYSVNWKPGINGLTLVAGDAVSFLPDICGHTAQVWIAIRAKLGNKACGLVTNTDLAGISGTLSLNSQTIASLKADDFSGLTSLEGLDLGGNELTSLPTGIFSDLDSLTSLDLSGNSITSLPDGLLGGLSKLVDLDLSSNALASLPDEIFNNPAKLTDLDLSGNSGAPFTVTLSLIAGDFNTVRVQMTSSAWATFGVPLVAGNGTLSMSSVTIPKGATLSNAVAFTPDSDSNTVSTVSIDTLPTLPTNFAGLTLAKGSSLTMIQGGICTRSPKVRAYILNALSGVSDCGEVTATHLASLTGTMTLSAQGATTLQAGDFAGLSGLTGLDLANRNIASLPQGVFGDLAKLTTLNLSGNSLTELPAGVFAGLSSLSSVDLSGNTGAPFTLPLVLREDGNGGVHVYLEHGAPRALSIPLQVAGGSLSASSVTIAAGATISQTVTYTADGSGDAMSVSFGVTLPSAGTGVQLGAGASLTFADDGICARTNRVRDAILASLGESDCSAVTRIALAGIQFLDLSNKSITSLRYGDFSGLSSLEQLYLGDNALTSLPEGVFSGLSSLDDLYLGDNALTSLPEGVFSGLSSLDDLSLSFNALTRLPEGVFSGLSSLNTLQLWNNNLTSLPSGMFSGLSSLESLNLSSNGLTSLPEGVFSGLSSLEILHLLDNGLTSLPEGVFSGLSSLTGPCICTANGLTSLPDGVFSGLSSLDDLAAASDNGLTSLPDGVFNGLSSLHQLHLYQQSLDESSRRRVQRVEQPENTCGLHQQLP